MDQPAAELRFDRAEYSTDAGPGKTPCSICRGSLGEQYYKWQRQIVCAACRDKVAGTLARSQSAAAFGKAAALGGATALACGVAYAIFVGLTKMQLALATIAIAWVIAKTIRKASGGIGGRRFQILAVALTYLASAMGYLPGVLAAVSHAAGGQASGAAHTSVAGFLLGIGFLVAVTLAAPFLEIAQAPIGVLIVVFGLWEAWRLSRGVPLTVEGPYRVARPAPGALAALPAGDTTSAESSLDR
jgi:hypothetical protein